MPVCQVIVYLEDASLRIEQSPPLGSKGAPAVNVPLIDLYESGPESAASRVGDYLLTILRQLSPQDFERASIPAQESTPGPDQFGIAMALIHASVSLTTSVHVASIEFILEQEAQLSERAKLFLSSSWPTIRARLESFAR